MQLQLQPQKHNSLYRIKPEKRKLSQRAPFSRSHEPTQPFPTAGALLGRLHRLAPQNAAADGVMDAS
jgi:hypothetical protein